MIAPSALLCCLLLVQPGSDRTPAPPAQPDASAASPLVPVKAKKNRLSPPQLVAQLLTPPENTTLTGKSASLKELLARAGSRSRQQEVARAYWNLSAAVAEYHATSQEQAELAWLQTTLEANPKLAPPHQAIATATQAAAATARVRDAELRATAAQLELADRTGAASNDPLPLPFDQPHVGGYRTYFEAKFAARSPAPRLRLIDKSLPILRKSIEARADAIQLAQDALDEAVASFEKGEADASTLAARFSEVARQRRAFLGTVREYNTLIAEYACATAGANDSVDRLLSMMIDTKPVVPAPPLDSSPDQPKTPANTDPSPAPSDGEAASVPSRELSAARLVSQSTPTSPTTPQSADQRLFAALAQATPLKRTQRLVTPLHWYRAIPVDASTGISLNACLAAVSPSARQESIVRYWQLCELAARFQHFSDRAELLSSAVPVVLAAREKPGGPQAMLQLQAAQFAADADRHDAEAALLAEQFAFTQRLNRPLDRPWLLPETLPHGGRYELRAEQQPRSVMETPGVQELILGIPKLHQALQDRSDAVVRADELRAAAIQAFEAEQLPIDQVLESFDEQTEQTLAFLATLTRYNDQIAEYALRVLTPQVTVDRLTNALVLQ